MELENSTLLSIIVGLAGILAELIFHNTLSNSVFGMVLCVVLALVILCCAYFALDGISYSMSAARKKEERRQREYDEKLYRLLNRRLSEQVRLEKAIFSRIAKGISIDGNLTGEQGMPFSAETLQELAGEIDRSTTKAAKMVARYGQKSQADTDKVLNDIRKDVLKSLDEIALEVKRLEDCLNEMNFSVADAVPDEDILSQALSDSGIGISDDTESEEAGEIKEEQFFEGEEAAPANLFEEQEEAAPPDLFEEQEEVTSPDVFEEQSDEEPQEEDKAEEAVLESEPGNLEQEISSDEIEAILRAASGADTEQEEAAPADLFEEQEEATPADLFAEREEVTPPVLFEEQPEEVQEEDKAEEAVLESDLGNPEQEISSDEIEAILRAASGADAEQDVDGADLPEDSLSDMDMAIELPAEVEALLSEDNAAPSEEMEKLPAEDNVVPSVEDLSPEHDVVPSEEAEALLPDDSALLAEAEALLAENNVTSEEQKPAELTALDILRMKQEEKEKLKAEQASASDAPEKEAASGEAAEATEAAVTAAASGDANKMMSPDDIAALIASMN